MWLFLKEEVLELFVEAQQRPQATRFGYQIKCVEDFREERRRVARESRSLAKFERVEFRWLWDFEKLVPKNDPDLRCHCGFNAHTRQQLAAHSWGHRRTALR